MKRLTLVRHAKSSWKDANLPDHDRPLNERGKQDAPTMGTRLAARKERPSLILTSTAVRARVTARLLADALSYPREFLQSDRTLYHADPGAILDIIAQQDDEFTHILTVGHNPGVTDLAQQLVPGFNVAELPTSALVTIALPISRWADVVASTGELLYFDFPKNEAPIEANPNT